MARDTTGGEHAPYIAQLAKLDELVRPVRGTARHVTGEAIRVVAPCYLLANTAVARRTYRAGLEATRAVDVAKRQDPQAVDRRRSMVDAARPRSSIEVRCS
jgi:hypothetical protein